MLKTKPKTLSDKAVYWLGVLAFGLVSGLGIQFAQAWTNPTATPPDGNVAGPITTGSVSQVKNGSLGVTKNFTWPGGDLTFDSNGAAIEFGGRGTPYFDFKNNPAEDFDIRLMLRNDDLLEVAGGDLKVVNGSAYANKFCFNDGRCMDSWLSSVSDVTTVRSRDSGTEEPNWINKVEESINKHRKTDLGTHKACFLTGVAIDAGTGFCTVKLELGKWVLHAYDNNMHGKVTTCQASCID
jgi:hypothetical protein